MNKQFYDNVSQQIKLNTGYNGSEKQIMLKQLLGMAIFDAEINGHDYYNLCDEINNIKAECVYGV